MILRTVIGTLTAAVLTASAVLLTSCNLVAPAAFVVAGQPKKDAEYILDDRPTVVFVDDRANVLTRTHVRRLIAEHTTQEIMSNTRVKVTINPNDAIRIARRETQQEPMSLEQIGRELGAEQIVYIEMLDFRSTPDSYTPRGVAACNVRVVDVANRVRLFPSPDSNDGSRTLHVTTREVSPDLYRTASGIRELEELLARTLGSEIAKLFYKHTPRELGSSLGGR